EALERACPVRVREYAIRRGSGGAGRWRGGDGLIREFEFLADARVSIIGDRRVTRPYGLAGGGPGKAGRNLLNGRVLPGKVNVEVRAGDRVRVESPGGGAFGSPVDR
ncbi:MAG: hydantoinase B/oxoprolinase family protein, partial [Planctomycetes bacterium]|nr:hydantoinase B/oxoprolinase family protein [Planctomycetota bacterium]